jgi:hypothetical protein
VRSTPVTTAVLRILLRGTPVAENGRDSLDPVGVSPTRVT